MLQRFRCQKGLSSTEIVVIVCAAVGGALIMLTILASLLVPSVLAVRERARRVMCMSNLREIGKGLVMYSGDYDDFYPTIRAKDATDSRPMASLALIYDMYVSSPKVFVCPSTTDNCSDLQPGRTFQPHGEPATPGDRRQCSYAYDDTRDDKTSSDIVIAGDAPPASMGRSLDGEAVGASLNSDNHFGNGQNVLLYGGDTVIWITNTNNPMMHVDDIYTAADPVHPGASDSYIHQ